MSGADRVDDSAALGTEHLGAQAVAERDADDSAGEGFVLGRLNACLIVLLAVVAALAAVSHVDYSRPKYRNPAGHEILTGLDGVRAEPELRKWPHIAGAGAGNDSPGRVADALRSHQGRRRAGRRGDRQTRITRIATQPICRPSRPADLARMRTLRTCCALVPRPRTPPPKSRLPAMQAASRLMTSRRLGPPLSNSWANRSNAAPRSIVCSVFRVTGQREQAMDLWPSEDFHLRPRC